MAASLEMYPMARKASLLLSQKPTDGTGDFAFAGSAVDEINSAGVSTTVLDNMARFDFQGEYVEAADNSYYLSDGTAKLTQLAKSLIDGVASDFEITLFLKTGADVTTQQTLIDFYTGASDRFALQIISGNIVSTINNGTAHNSSGAIVANTSYMISLSWDASTNTNTVYIDKVAQVGTTGATTIGTTATYIYVGATNGTSNYSTVQWQQIHVDNRLLTTAQRLDRYNGVAIDPKYIGANNVSVTAGSFTIGLNYRIDTIGTTDFTLAGATSNTVGLEFKATAVGAGTGTATTAGNTLLIDGGKTDVGTTEKIIFVGHDSDFSNTSVLHHWIAAFGGVYSPNFGVNDGSIRITAGGIRLNSVYFDNFIGEGFFVQCTASVDTGTATLQCSGDLSNFTPPQTVSTTPTILDFYVSYSSYISFITSLSGNTMTLDNISFKEAPKWYDKTHNIIAGALAPLNNPNGFTTNVHPILTCPKVRFEPSAINYFLNGSVPVTQTISTVIGTKYTCSIKDAGLLTLDETGGNGRGGVVTEVDSFTYTATATSMVVTVITAPTNVNFTDTSVPIRYIPTAGITVAKVKDQITQKTLAFATNNFEIFLEQEIFNPTESLNTFKLTDGTDYVAIYNNTLDLNGVSLALPTGNNKIIIQNNATNIVAYVNGALFLTGTRKTTTLNALDLTLDAPAVHEYTKVYYNDSSNLSTAAEMINATL